MLFAMTEAEAQAVLWSLAHAKPVADREFPRSCLVAQIEGLSERLGSVLSLREAQEASRLQALARLSELDQQLDCAR